MTPTPLRRLLLAALGAALAGSVGQTVRAASITSLGDFANGYWSRALSVSADGQAVAGTSYQFDGSRRAFRWTATGGLADLGAINSSFDNVASALSRDGSVAVGFSGNDSFRWTAAGGLSALAHLTPGSVSTATAVSGDGATIVGFEDGTTPFLWRSTGVTALGVLAGQPDARPGAITRDAAFVGGSSGLNLVRWTGTTPTALANFSSDAGVAGYGISDDGAVVVGEVVHPGGNNAEGVRWIEGVGASLLGDIAGGDFNSVAFGTTADGHTLVGYGSDTPFWTTATIWTAATGWQRLSDVLASQGVNLSYWLSLDEATAISPDGSVVVGSGTVAATGLQQAFVARITPLPVPAPAPFGGTARALPGRVQAEDYDTGGQLVGHFDTTAGNSGGLYRSDTVDIVAANDGGTGGFAVQMASRDWQDYTVNVTAAGNYVLRLRVARAAAGNGALRILSGPANASLVQVGSDLVVPSTGGANLFTVVEADVALTAGTRILRVQCPTGDVNVNWFEVVQRGIRREVWTNVSGPNVSQIPVNTPPNLVDTLATTETPQNWADRYGTRLRGYIKAPATGSYVFWTAADDSSELWLSTSTNPSQRVKIAQNTTATGFRRWTVQASQKSAAINLVAGQLYYIEVLQKENSGTDNLSVGWARPGQSTSAPSEIIPTAVLSPFIP